MIREKMAVAAMDQSGAEDYPLSAVPDGARQGFWPITLVLLGFTFFSATMWGGASLGVAFRFWPDLAAIILCGNAILAVYVAGLSYVGFRSGLSTVLTARFAFGNAGSRWCDALLGLTQIGWYAWGTATIAIVLVRLLGLDPGLQAPLMIVFGLGFCLTAYIGCRGLAALSRVAVPAMLLLIAASVTIALRDAGDAAGPLMTGSLTVAEGLTIVVGTFVSGGTQVANWTRFAGSARTAVGSSILAFFFGNGLMIAVGAVGAVVYGLDDIVEVLAVQGILSAGILLLFLNIWTTQDNTIYNVSVAGCHFFRTERRRLITFAGAGAGTLLALFGMYDLLIPYMVMMGVLIPPLGGVIMADFFVRHRGRYPVLNETAALRFNRQGLAAYAAGSLAALVIPGIPPVNGIVAAFLLYACLVRFT
ncbi:MULTISPECIES: cytosine permease [unclassified Methanoculleus]|uniref:cytosine permease n=1 Tax=unclassified Methanoculleus TaxID=2619537 RepID=UPI0025FEEE83|nr:MULTISPECIES: cytosine permease [unclassified Methanoculleus]MCK9317470.1 cytosine permease [Methanoculleus sp.]MDD2252978.1 cytosine permease [Methanoculleus sp.]MDD2787358.1 cytosine permease [Methanoculleus sp.]MDD3215953.1 cytosine permease [Methanoculleus sp.]MDD4313703.1 cytosine permease [Methanoculleus sp.]